MPVQTMGLWELQAWDEYCRGSPVSNTPEISDWINLLLLDWIGLPWMEGATSKQILPEHTTKQIV